MRVVIRVARKECAEIVRDGRYVWAAAIVFCLLLASLALGWMRYRELRADRTAAQAVAYDQWLKQGKRNAHSAAHYGMYAFKPATPLSFIERGVEPYTGAVVFLEAHKQNEFKLRPAKDTVAVARFGDLTAAVTLQLLLPLLIIALTFSAFLGEREQGTMRQLLSLGVAPTSLGAGKALGIAAALLALLVPATIIGTIALIFSSVDGTLAESLPRAALFALVYIVYFLIILMVSLAVSARASSSRVALAVLLAFWVVNCLIVPRAGADLARRLHPTPSTIRFSREIGREILNSEHGRSEKLKQRVLDEYGVSRGEDLPFNFEGMDLQDSDERGNAVIDRYYGELHSVFARQFRLQEAGAIIAPYQAMRLLSMGLAGTDPAQHLEFSRAVEEYRRMMVKLMKEEVARNTGEIDPSYRGTQALNRTVGREVWEKVPPFVYTAPGSAWVLGNHRWSVLMLLAWAALSVWMAWRGATKLRVV